LDFSGTPSFSKVRGAASKGRASAGTEGPASEVAYVVQASPYFFKTSPSVLGAAAKAGVGTFIDSMIVSSTLAILLFLGVAAGILDAFRSSVSRNEFRAFGCSAAFFSTGPSAGSIPASTGAERLGSATEEDPQLASTLHLFQCAWDDVLKP
jgi:F0F1-type ATP synthase assembly protein I